MSGCPKHVEGYAVLHVERRSRRNHSDVCELGPATNMTDDTTPPPLVMSGGDFRAWRKRHRLTQAAAGAELGRTVQQIRAYEAGRKPIPRAIVLACTALEIGPLSLIRRRSQASRDAGG